MDYTNSDITILEKETLIDISNDNKLILNEKRITEEILYEMIEKHKNGARIICYDCDFSDLRFDYGTVLTEAKFVRCDFSNCFISRGIFVDSIFYSCIFVNAWLEGAIFAYADLTDSTFKSANLRMTDFARAELTRTDFENANTKGAIFYKAMDGKDIDNPPYIPLACPSDGSFIGWKAAYLRNRNTGDFVDCLVKLEIPADAKRSSAFSNKCRCDKAIVLGVETWDGKLVYDPSRFIEKSKFIEKNHDDLKNYEIVSRYCDTFTYKLGDVITPVCCFDENRFNECSIGIHFFINKEEAFRYIYC